MIILLAMERSWIKGGSFSSAGSMGQGTEGDTSCLRPGVEFSCGRQCVPLAALQRLGEGFGCGVPSAPSSCSAASLPPSLPEDRASLTPGSQQQKSLKGKLPCS